MGKVEEDLVGADVGVFGRVYACEVVVFEEDCTVRWGQRGEGKGAL